MSQFDRVSIIALMVAAAIIEVVITVQIIGPLVSF